MAIKGKRRSRGGGRTVAAAPRPRLVAVKPPVFRRTWFRVTVVVVLLGMVAALAAGVLVSRRNAAAEADAREEVARVGVIIENSLVGLGQVFPDGTVSVLPELSAAIAEVRSGEFRERRIRNRSEGWAQQAEEAAAALRGARTDDPDLERALATMADGMALYAEAARRLPEALDVKGADRRRLLGDLEAQVGEARGSVSSGVLIYLNRRIAVGLAGEDAPVPGFQTVIPPGNPLQPPGPGEVVPEPVPTG